MRLKAHAIWWDEKLGNVKLHQMIDMKYAQKGKRLIWKRCPEREKIELKKMPKKGKYWYEKDAQMGKECDENDENGLPNVNLPI